MELNHEACYRAVQARDARYDGRFFTCVKSTGIYCRPICPARPPKAENCIFVPTAAAAQAAGFRPCLRCRPESSPELDTWRGTEATVSRALKLIEAGTLDSGDITSLADRLGIGERQLRRLFSRHIGAAPITVAQTRRVLLAKQLIHQTELSMIEIALASGFGSVRRFNETFQKLYGRPPKELRRRAAAGVPSPEVTILLPYRPPYDWAALLEFFRARAIAGLEVVTQDSYSRVIELDDIIGSIHVSHAPEQTSLRVTVRIPRLAVLPTIISRVRRLFDLGAEPNAIASALSTDPMLKPLVLARPGLRVPGAWDGFEIAVRAILGQQITVKAATTLAGRIVSTLGTKVAEQSGAVGLTHAFPGPEQFESKVLAKLGMTKARAMSLVGMADAARSDPHLFDLRRDLGEAVAHVKRLAGVGEWTAQYIAMRALGESDAFLVADVALQRSFEKHARGATAQQILKRAERWRPWRAYATMHLWMAAAESRRAASNKEIYDAISA
jgi:AraC family transcriptional regulator of adaptative response / DNA-3-methyladenine glycosylase II